jgi:hypothetical protein
MPSVWSLDKHIVKPICLHVNKTVVQKSTAHAVHAAIDGPRLRQPLLSARPALAFRAPRCLPGGFVTGIA